MRIISGKWKGKRLAAPKNLPVRPTTDFAKEGLFNVLNSRFYFEDICVLDLFAGIGSISYEFASRGCKKITSIDKNGGCIKFISDVKKSLDFEVLETFKIDVFKFLNQKAIFNYDIIFADAPFDFELNDYKKIVTLIKENQWLNPNGILIIEHSKHKKLNDFKYYSETKKYGNVHFSFFTF